MQSEQSLIQPQNTSLSSTQTPHAYTPIRNEQPDMHTEPMNESSVALIESCVIPQNYVDPDIPIEQLLQQQNTAPQIPFPHIASSPVNTFQQ